LSSSPTGSTRPPGWQHEAARVAFAADERAHVQHRRDQRCIDRRRGPRGWDELRAADPASMTDRELAAYEDGDDQVSYYRGPGVHPEEAVQAAQRDHREAPARAARAAADRAHQHQQRDHEIAQHQDQHAGHDRAAAGGRQRDRDEPEVDEDPEPP